MNLLLDTHIWLWSLLEPERLSRRVARTLRNTENHCWLSPISVWEALMLLGKKRITITGGAETIERMAAAGSLREAVLTHEVAVASGRVTVPHRDPADRFLVATACVYGLTLVTADRQLAGVKDCPVLINR